MLPRVKRLCVLAIVSMMVAVNATAADRLVDRRMDDVDQRPARVAVTGDNSSGSNNLVELFVQLESLQNEVRELRNQVEIQTHEINQLKESQRNMMRDTDNRLRKLQQGAVQTPVAPPVADEPESDKPDKTAEGSSKPEPVADNLVKAQKDYDAAFQKLRDGRYKQAIADFETFLKTYPKHKLASNAQYWIAKSHYVNRNYKQALDGFDKTIKLYPLSSKIPDAMLNKGYTLYDLGKYPEARKVLSETAKRYKNTRTGKRASKRLEQMKKEGR